MLIFEQKNVKFPRLIHISYNKKYGNNEKYRFGIIAKEAIERY